MARQPQSSTFAYDEEFGSRKTWRLAIWAGIATAAIVIAAVAAFVDGGSRLIARTSDPLRPPVPAATTPGSTFDGEMEARRLAEAVRLLAADRDRLMARINALERNLTDVTGSIPGGSTPGRTANASVPPMLSPAAIPAPAAPQSGPLPPSTGSAAAPATRQPHPAAPAANRAQEPAVPADRLASLPAADTGPTGSVATRTEFGVDLGGAASVDGLRALWVTLKSTNEGLFEGLRPVVAIREGSKPGVVELRLVAGPLGNAGAAARLCATLAAVGSTCQPTIFDGQRLALK